MSHKVETMAYANETPWHGLGFPVSDGLTPKEMLKAAKLDWTVSKRPAAFLDKKGKPVIIKDEYALVRDSDEQPLTMVGSTYKPVQNEEAFDFFKKFVKAGHMKMETAGSLWGGRYTWALARINADFKIGRNDELRNYLLLSSPHVHGRSLVMQYTNVRVVCWNTINMALGAGLKGNNSSFRMPHTQRFDERTKIVAEHSLGIAKEQIAQFKAAIELLAKKKATADKVEEYFGCLLQWDPKANEAKTKATIAALKASAGITEAAERAAREPKMLPLFREALISAPGAQLSTAQGTWWGACNAVTRVVDHGVGRERGTALKGAWFGQHRLLKENALKLALEYAQ